jgi:hypothetical protein
MGGSGDGPTDQVQAIHWELCVRGRRSQGLRLRDIGVSWHKGSSIWRVQVRDPQTKNQRHIGSFASEEDAARAYDCAAVQAHGPGAKRNFLGEANSELPVAVGEEQKQRSSSRFIGVSWHKSSSSWQVQVRDPQTKRSRHVGSFASEEDAARAYDCAAVQAHGPGAKRNFPPASIDTNHVSGDDGDIPPAALVRSLGESTSMHTFFARALPPPLFADHGSRSFLVAAAQLHPSQQASTCP